MKLTQVRGNTWVLDSWELIPLYKLDDHRCVLLDTGTVEQREELEETLDEAGLTPGPSWAATPTSTTWAPTPTSKRPGAPRW